MTILFAFQLLFISLRRRRHITMVKFRLQRRLLFIDLWVIRQLVLEKKIAQHVSLLQVKFEYLLNDC